MVLASEDYKSSQLHQLIIELLQTVKSPDIDKSLEAVKCLGELGPSDLSNIVLKPDQQLHTYKYVSIF